ncbi:Mov34-domain-containing protein [Leucogyrophana mollusca]|uniref:Mov34-domain-containing protein n=1 Tax=Leucogyrophana mollusca TaxID=85980 RepID=A0ACB8BVZ1_9AGAM|nr:Mov34-domain-containing protein [Leucogyrophana mollusca]
MSSAPSSARRPSPRQVNTTRRPPSIAELADRALSGLWDPSKGLKQWLKTADTFRKAGRAYAEAGDFESAFSEYAKAATIILEKLPTHKEYYTLLTSTQRHNLGLNGQNILDSLSELKPTLVDRYERWLAQNPEEATRPRTTTSHVDAGRHEESRRHDTDRRAPQDDSGWSAQEAARKEASDRRREREEQRMMEQRKEDARRRAAEADQRQRQEARMGEHLARLQIDTENRKKDDAIAAARRAANLSTQESNFSRRSRHEGERSEPVTPVSADERRRESEAFRYQDELKRREEEGVRQRRKREQEGIARRQEEAEAASRVARRSLVPSPSTMPAPTAVSSQRSPFIDTNPQGASTPLPMPLESPTRNQASTTPTGPPRTLAYPAPVTTTSPAPPDGHIRYPQLMSQHQLKQGYAPSLQSMFTYPSIKPPNLAPSSLLFIPEASTSHHTAPSNLYSSELLPNPSAPVIPHQSAAYSYATHPGQGSTPERRPALPAPPPQSGYSILSKNPQSAPPPPQPPLHHADGDRYRTASQESARIIRPQNPKAADPTPDLKSVSLPRECLPRFLSIASLNTSRNRETCGLLLGKDKGNKFVVTTLLIPKQHSTSDTCTMDEEELVMQFTEERSLITLGWIHTHPSQSCFMSSVDLHTHSGFQRMLPESFAVVCAPKSTPNFGIFRLTDPPGLQTILSCNAKEAFHPHPDLPIYTDADKGHVQMKDVPLEIVDLR